MSLVWWISSKRDPWRHDCSQHCVRRWEPDTQLCCYTAKHGAFRQVKSYHLPSSAGRQDQLLHSKARDVGKTPREGKYWLLWASEWICWNQWFGCHHSDSMCQGAHLLPERIFFKNTSQTTVLSMTGWEIPPVLQHLLISALLKRTSSLRWHLTPSWDYSFHHRHWVLGRCGERASTHWTEGYEYSASLRHLLPLWDWLFCCCLPEKNARI